MSRGGSWWMSARGLVVIGLVVRRTDSMFLLGESKTKVRLSDAFELEGQDFWSRGWCMRAGAAAQSGYLVVRVG